VRILDRYIGLFGIFCLGFLVCLHAICLRHGVPEGSDFIPSWTGLILYSLGAILLGVAFIKVHCD